MNIIECLATQSYCYNTTTIGVPVGILIHDTGAGNPNLKRYVQPSANDPKRAELLKIIGTNPNGNSWNRPENQALVNLAIGKKADGTVGIAQVLPWNYRPYGCGSGVYGSCNGTRDKNSPFWIQFEILDDAWNESKKDYTNGNPNYFYAVYDAMVWLVAYICNKFNFDPKGKVNYKGIQIPVVTCHYEAHQLGFASGHRDVIQWFARYGKNMTTIRNAVAEKVKGMKEMTREEVENLLQANLAPLNAKIESLQSQADSLRASNANLQADVSTLRLRNQELQDECDEANLKLGKWIARYEDIPESTHLRPMTRKLLDSGVINGGTPYDVDPDDIGLPMNDLRVLLVAAKYAEKLNEKA